MRTLVRGLVVVAAVVVVGGTTALMSTSAGSPVANPYPDGAGPSAAPTSVSVTADLASTHVDERSLAACDDWLVPGGGGPAGARLTAALDSTAGDVRRLLLSAHKDAAGDVNLRPLGDEDFVAVCSIDIRASRGFGSSTSMLIYATPQNDGVGLISLD